MLSSNATGHVSADIRAEGMCKDNVHEKLHGWLSDS